MMAFDCTLSVESELDHDYEKAYKAMSTNTHNLEPFIGAVNEINPVTIDVDDGRVFTENRWVVGRSYIPDVLFKYFGLNELAAVTHVSWNHDTVKNTWTMDLETVDYFDVSGSVDFYENHGDDRVSMTINIEAESLPMLPVFLESTAESTVKMTLESVFTNALQTVSDNMDTLIEKRQQQEIETLSV